MKTTRPYGSWELKRIESGGRHRDVRCGYQLSFGRSGRYSICFSGNRTAKITGHFEVDGERISRWVDPGLQLLDFRFRIEDGHLRLVFPDGKVFSFDRLGSTE